MIKIYINAFALKDPPPIFNPVFSLLAYGGGIARTSNLKPVRFNAEMISSTDIYRISLDVLCWDLAVIFVDIAKSDTENNKKYITINIFMEYV